MRAAREHAYALVDRIRRCSFLLATHFECATPVYDARQAVCEHA